ncbi:MAG: hypothetical protein JRF52_01235 [Deltaproteobacteria bacterium]|jgi:hypothetical protein|uniref:Uncharacterized protein n=1 Tax=Candidatus Desulfacyla euxinica TaxID=2841693 RepID=A0A8J6N3W2_9DELT|nr:hypothetical protein [Candidatus Desulfacyla euxinica]MBL7217599.1 hypothetical protein [Desulfobacteraceae bacterium]MBW1867749.1 hypothetical protein [Deltaproteobacteria bacterium]MBW2202739.1 hypothetical protein [Deltaproteobacteria bacterium]HIJ58180.1 hypothetical protein [Deltaproteobacteria bacterium]
MNQMTTNMLRRIAKTDFVSKAIEEQADLSAFKERPTGRIIVGISAIGFSYIIGWPAISLLGVMSIYFNKPLIVIIGGPLTYGLSHLVFILGMYLAGAKYTKIFIRWAARVIMEKFLGSESEV